jgi:CHAD domain-containing protein
LSDSKRSGKWIRGIDGSTPLLEAATTIIEARMRPIVELLPLAHKSYREDVEYIHQLRVSTRRADAALKSFRDCFRKKRFKKARERLREIRRAAGGARTADVHIMMFEERLESASDADRPVIRFALERTRRRREEVQQAVDEAAAHHPPHKLERTIDKLLATAREPKKSKSAITLNGLVPTLHDAAMAELPGFLKQVQAAANDDLSVFENLHQLRIEAKRLRYSMEIFAPCFDEGFRSDLYPRMKELQDRLGAINDAHEMSLRFGRYAEEAEQADAAVGNVNGGGLAAGLHRFAQDYRAERERLREAFLSWWKTSGGASIIGELERYICTPAAPG